MKVYAVLILFLFTLGNCKRCDNEKWITPCKNSEGPMAMMKTGDCDFCNNTQRFCEGECLGLNFFTCWDRHVFENPDRCDEAYCEVVDGKRTGVCTMRDVVSKNNSKEQGEEEPSEDGKEKIPDKNTEKPKEHDENKTPDIDDKSATNDPNKEVVNKDQHEDISNVEMPNDGSNNKDKQKEAANGVTPETVTPTNNQSKADNFIEPADDKGKNKCNNEGGTCDGTDDKDSKSTSFDLVVSVIVLVVSVVALIAVCNVGNPREAQYEFVQNEREEEQPQLNEGQEQMEKGQAQMGGHEERNGPGEPGNMDGHEGEPN